MEGGKVKKAKAQTRKTIRITISKQSLIAFVRTPDTTPLGRQRLSEITHNYEGERAKRNTKIESVSEKERERSRDRQCGSKQTSSALIKN